MRFFFVSFLALFLILSSPALSLSADQEPTTSTLRVLSLAPSVTEMIYAIGAEDQLVGVTDFCQFPPEAKSKTQTGGYLNPNFELMLSLQPDVAFHTPGERRLESQLRSARIELVPVPANKVQDIRDGLMIVGKRLGREQKAREVIERFNADISRIEANNDPDAEKPEVLLVLGRPRGGVRDIFAVGPNTFLDELLHVAGARNVMEDSPAPYPTASKEILIKNPPDLIIEARSWGEELTDEMREQVRSEWRVALGPGAVGKTRVVLLDDPHLSIPGPGIISSLASLQEIIHSKEGLITGE